MLLDVPKVALPNQTSKIEGKTIILHFDMQDGTHTLLCSLDSPYHIIYIKNYERLKRKTTRHYQYMNIFYPIFLIDFPYDNLLLNLV
jgi:hypothetical protein